MSNPIGSFSGIASGVQWRDLVDQIMDIESARRLTPLQTRQTLSEKRVETWTAYQGLMTKFRDAARALNNSADFASFTVGGGTSGATGRTLLTASASSGASPGSFGVEVLDLARANKLSGAVMSSASTGLGLAGEFGVNGQKVAIVATDSLATVRDKINALNIGANPSGVTASVLSTGSSQHRLVLSSDAAGSSGIELLDDAAGVLQSLGVIDASKSLNLAANGGAQSYRVSSATTTVAAMLGVTMPPPSTIEIGGRVITVDLTVDSLSSIAAKIAAAGGNGSVVEESQNGKVFSRLVTSDTVTATTPDGQRTLEILGFVKNGRSGIAQVVQSENVFNDGVGGAAAAGTLLSNLTVGGNSLALVAGDTISIAGKRGDGSSVSISMTVGAGDTMQTLLNRINSSTDGFGAGGRSAAASLSGGQIVLTDGTTGDSLLSLSVSATRASDGSIVNMGRQLTQTVGRLREVVSGTDASVRVDGVVIQRSGNIISDAIAGVTLNLQQAEIGTTTVLTIDRDRDAITDKVKDLATAYNELVKFRTEQQKENAPLRNNATLRGAQAQLTNQLLSDVTGLVGSYKRAGSAGLSLQTDGTLKLDEAVFKKALDTNYTDVVNLFTTVGTSPNAELTLWLSGEKSIPGTYAVDITAAATVPTISGTGFSGTYADDGTADTLTISDTISGASGDILLANGDTTDTIVTKMNTLFSNSKMQLSASNVGGQVVITGSRYGSAASFTTAYTPGGADGTAQLGIAANTYAGTDVAGTIGGLAATGAGQILTGAAGGPTEGLGITYSGTAIGAVGDFTFTLGVSGMLYNAADVIGRPGGVITSQNEVIERTINDIKGRADTVQQSLDRRRQALIRQFVEMERAISQIQAQGGAITNFLSQLQAQNN